MGPALLCLATLFSCKNESLIPEDNADDMIEMPAGPSDDALAVTMDKKVYVFPYEYSGEGKAVAARATNQVPCNSGQHLFHLFVRSLGKEAADFFFQEA